MLSAAPRCSDIHGLLGWVGGRELAREVAVRFVERGAPRRDFQLTVEVCARPLDARLPASHRAIRNTG